MPKNGNTAGWDRVSGQVIRSRSCDTNYSASELFDKRTFSFCCVVYQGAVSFRITDLKKVGRIQPHLVHQNSMSHWVDSNASAIFINKRMKYWSFAIDNCNKNHNLFIITIIAFYNYVKIFTRPNSVVLFVGLRLRYKYFSSVQITHITNISGFDCSRSHRRNWIPC